MSFKGGFMTRVFAVLACLATLLAASGAVRAVEVTGTHCCRPSACRPSPTNLAGSVQFTCAGRTDVGVVRSGNEDNYLMVRDHGLFIVADGMGGHAAGEVASEMAVRIIAQKIGDIRDLDDVTSEDV